MSKLLIDDQPLQALPKLAVALKSVDAAIVLQQINYWIVHKSAPVREGRSWHYATYQEWLDQFPWLSATSLRRIINDLEAKGLIISKEFNRSKGDRTKWYTIDRQKFDEFELENITPPHVSKLDTPSVQIDQTICPNWTLLNKEEENTKETNKDINHEIIICDDERSPPKKIKVEKWTREEVEENFETLWDQYPNKKGKQAAKEWFLKNFLPLRRGDAENLYREIVEGLMALMLERVLYEKGAKQFPRHANTIFFRPHWKHGDLWLSKKCWLDGKYCKKTYAEVLDHVTRENPGFNPNSTTYAEIFARSA